MVSKLRRKLFTVIVRRWGWTQAAANAAYEVTWQVPNLDYFNYLRTRRVACNLSGGDLVECTLLQLNTSHLEFVGAYLSGLRRGAGPSLRVLEVGSGCGLNLAYLAARHPTGLFVGAELTLSGATRTALWGAIEDGEFRRWISSNGLGDDAGSVRVNPGRLSAIRSNSLPLPFRAETFDVVFSRLALEQMIDCYLPVIVEVHRVLRSGGLFVAIEPFRDFQNLRQYARLWLRNYFRAPISVLTNVGFEIVEVCRDIAHQQKWVAGAVVARRRSRMQGGTPPMTEAR